MVNEPQHDAVEEIKKEPPRLSELPFQLNADPTDYLDLTKLDSPKLEITNFKHESQNMFGMFSKVKSGTKKKEKEVDRSSIVSLTKPIKDKDLEDTATIGSRSSMNLGDFGAGFGPANSNAGPLVLNKERSNSNLFRELQSKPASLKNAITKEDFAGKTREVHHSPLKSNIPVIGIVSASTEDMNIEIEDDTEGYVDPFALVNAFKDDPAEEGSSHTKPKKLSYVPSVSSTNPNSSAIAQFPSSGISLQTSPSTGVPPSRARRPSLISAISAAMSSDSPSAKTERSYSGVSDNSESLSRNVSGGGKGHRISTMFSSAKKKSEKGVTPLPAICPRCKLDSSDVSNQAIVDQKKYHPSCLTCSHCKTKLVDEVFLWKDEVVCQRDYFFLSGFTCSVCDASILNNYVTVGGKKAHASCRPCSLCHQSLYGKEYTVLGDSIFCSEHKDIIPCFACQKRIDGAVLEVHFHSNIRLTGDFITQTTFCVPIVARI